MTTRWLRSVLVVTAVLALGTPAHADLVKYYVAHDQAATVPTWSFFSGLPNPNQGRLTLLFAHTDGAPTEYHFHEIGYYSYRNPDRPTIVNRSYYSFVSDGVLYRDLPGFTIPEQFSDFGITPSPLPLRAGHGLYAGTQVSGVILGNEYSDLTVGSASELAPFAAGTPEHHLLHNLDGFNEDWTGSLDGAVIALELVAKSAGLHIGSPNVPDILENPGDRYTFAFDGSAFRFTPALWVDEDATGAFSATFRLVDVRATGTPLGPSGEFVINVAAVPAPGSLMLVAIAAGILGLGGALAYARSPRRAGRAAPR